MATYFITGATGHLGYHLTRLLISKGHRIYALVLPGDPLVTSLPPSVIPIVGNILNEASIETFLSQPGDQPRILIHAASHVTTDMKANPLTFEVNVTGTKNLWKQLQPHAISHMIYVSSVHALKTLPKGQVVEEIHHALPKEVLGYYAKTKAEATQFLLNVMEHEQAPISIVYPSGFIGPHDLGGGYTTLMIQEAVAQRMNIWFHGGYDFVDVRDVAQAIVTLAERSYIGQTYILNNTFISFKHLMTTIDRVNEQKPYRVYIPKLFIWLAIPVLGLYYRWRKQKPLLNRYALITMSSHARFSHQKATQALNFHPRDLHDTIKDTLTALQQRQQKKA